MFRKLGLGLLVAFAIAACSDRSGPPLNASQPAPNAAVPAPTELRTCPRGVGCF